MPLGICLNTIISINYIIACVDVRLSEYRTHEVHLISPKK